MTPQELKNSILQLAIQGRLVPQRAEEGTAEELYKQIQAEKQKLIKAGKIKKEKPLSAITDDEKPFEIPDSWKWVRFSNIIFNIGNKSNQILAKNVKQQGKYAVVSQSKNEIDGFCDSEEKVIYDLPLIVFGDHTRTVKYIDFPFIVGADGTKCLKPILIIPKYFFYWLTFIAKSLKNRGYARHYTLLVNYIFPLPPLAEQKRIVAKIEELLPYVERYEKAYNELQQLNKRFPDDLQKSVLQLAIQGRLVPQCPEEGNAEDLYKQIQAEKQNFIKAGKIKKEKPLPAITDDEKPFEIPENWKWVRLGDLGFYKKGPFGSALTKSMFVSKGNGAIKVYEQKNAIKKDVKLGEYYIKREYFEEKMKGFELFAGDIIVSCAGTIGETYVMPDNFERGIINQALMKIKLFAPTYMPYFLMYFDFILKKNAKTNSKGSAIKNIPPFEILKKYLVPIPPFAEQKRIVAKLEEILPLCDKLK